MPARETMPSDAVRSSCCGAGRRDGSFHESPQTRSGREIEAKGRAWSSGYASHRWPLIDLQLAIKIALEWSERSERSLSRVQVKRLHQTRYLTPNVVKGPLDTVLPAIVVGDWIQEPSSTSVPINQLNMSHPDTEYDAVSLHYHSKSQQHIRC